MTTKEPVRDFHMISNKQLEDAKISYEFTLNMMKSYANQQSIILNPHEATLNREIKGLIINLNKFGYLYCPCRLKDLTGDISIDKRICCPCAYHKKELTESGFCKCELFVKPLEESSRLISTTIHRLKIKQQSSENKLEIYFEKNDRNHGEVKIYIPQKFTLDNLTVKSSKSFEIKERTFIDQILFFIFDFEDQATIIAEYS